MHYREKFIIFIADFTILLKHEEREARAYPLHIKRDDNLAKMLKSNSIIICPCEKVCIPCDFKTSVIFVGFHHICIDKGCLMDKVMAVFMQGCGGAKNLKMNIIKDNLAIPIDNANFCPPPLCLLSNKP